jgi:hypothetical protein
MAPPHHKFSVGAGASRRQLQPPPHFAARHHPLVRRRDVTSGARESRRPHPPPRTASRRWRRCRRSEARALRRDGVGPNVDRAMLVEQRRNQRGGVKGRGEGVVRRRRRRWRGSPSRRRWRQRLARIAQRSRQRHPRRQSQVLSTCGGCARGVRARGRPSWGGEAGVGVWVGWACSAGQGCGVSDVTPRERGGCVGMRRRGDGNGVVLRAAAERREGARSCGTAPGGGGRRTRVSGS